MFRRRIATGLTTLLGGGIIAVGLGYLTDSKSVTSGFGVPEWDAVDRAAYRVKGIRDVASGIAPLVLLALGQRRALGWVLLTEAIVPAGDMVTVLRSGGPRSAAYGIHGATAAAVLAAGGLLLSE
jgi:uncharacterized membrane protein